MKIERKGAVRNAGQKTLVSDDLTNRLGENAFGKGPRWSADFGTLSFEVLGFEENATYEYKITITGKEVLKFIELLFARMEPTMAKK